MENNEEGAVSGRRHLPKEVHLHGDPNKEKGQSRSHMRTRGRAWAEKRAGTWALRWWCAGGAGKIHHSWSRMSPGWRIWRRQCLRPGSQEECEFSECQEKPQEESELRSGAVRPLSSKDHSPESSPVWESKKNRSRAASRQERWGHGPGSRADRR